MTAHTAQQLGIKAAREAYRQWDRLESPADIVWTHRTRLDHQLRAEGLTADDDEAWGAAGLAFRDEAEHLFGHDHIGAGQ